MKSDQSISDRFPSWAGWQPVCGGLIKKDSLGLGVYLRALSACRDLNSGLHGPKYLSCPGCKGVQGLGTIVAPDLSVACQTLWHLLNGKKQNVNIQSKK
jgi:hypothetical protein